MSEASCSSKISTEDAQMKESSQREPKKIHFRRILLEIKKSESSSIEKIYKQ
jgi:hypothetical protein